MSDHSDPIAAASRTRERNSRPGPGPTIIDAPEPAAHNGNGYHRRPAREQLDPWELARLILGRWPWLLLGAVLGGVAFFYLGQLVIREKHTAKAQLLRYETPGATDFFPVISPETFTALIRSPELLSRVGGLAVPPIREDKFAKMIKVVPETESDLINITLAARTPVEAVNLLNLYASNTVDFARQYYAQHAETAARNYLLKQLEEMNRDISALEERFRNAGHSPAVGGKFAEVAGELTRMNTSLASGSLSASVLGRQRERLDKALGELDELLSRYTDIHPRVIEKRAQIQSLEQNLAASSTNQALAVLPAPRGPNDFNPEADLIRTKLLALEDGRIQLANRQREAELFAANPPGIVRLFAPPDIQTVQANHHQIKIGVVTAFGAGLGMLAMLLLAFLVEFADNRVKTSSDLRRVTGLPFLASLGDLNRMGPEARSQWAFRAWTMLQGRLSPSPNHGLVCGITSARAGEGRSTWIELLAEAASLTGFRVLTIATRPSAQPLSENVPAPETPFEERQMNNPSQLNSAITTSVLAAPDQVTQKLTGPNPQPMVHIPLPGWVWNLDRRRQWGEALSHWRQIDNLVILVELPPASVPEAVLLGSNLPNMVWLSDAGKSDATEIRDQLETLRHARCNLVGAVLNRESAGKLKKRFSRWLAAGALLAALNSSSTALAAEPREPEPADRLAPQEILPSPAQLGFSITRPSQRAAWQERLTLGPGDVLSVGLFGEPDATRTEIVIGPDGRLGFLEAQDIVATGRTVDELRSLIDDELGKYRRAARSVVTPVAFKSKKYYVLGRVMTKGVYVLDRPITVLEAIARAHGLENALVDRNLVDLTDFQRSFLARQGQRIPINFERLFLQGDLSQNIPIEPDDYLYFASAELQEVYVVGEVRLPGPVVYRSDLTAIGAITSRGGYTDRAFKSRVLVIRGSLQRPEPIIVNTRAAIDGESLDFRLQPRDIIFVNSRPFIRVEELADRAATAFIQSIITEWVGVQVVKPIN